MRCVLQIWFTISCVSAFINGLIMLFNGCVLNICTEYSDEFKYFILTRKLFIISLIFCFIFSFGFYK